MILDEILRQILVYLYNFTENYGISIIALSFVVFALMLPLFWVAEKLQYKDLIRKAAMQTSLTEIEDVKNKQEKYYYTKEIFKKHNYKAYYPLINIVGLLIQIPFFLAAYWMLSDFDSFNGQKFGPILDLNNPDGLINVGTLNANALPFLMTIVNLIAIYFSKNKLHNKEIYQLFSIAILFLIILYSSSSALVIYWTASNFFSIFKNKLILNERNIETVDLPNYKFSLSIIKKRIIIYEKEISNILIILLVYFFFIHLLLTLFLSQSISSSFFQAPQSMSSKVFLLATLLSFTILFSINSFNKNRGNHLVYFVYIFILIGSLLFLSGSFRGLIEISIKSATIFHYLMIFFGFILLIFRLKIRRLSLKKKSIFLLKKSQYAPFLSLLIPLTVYLQTNLEFFNVFSGFQYYFLMIGVPILVFHLTYLVFEKSINERIYIPSFVAIILSFYLVPTVTNLTGLNADNNFIPHLLTLFFIIAIFILLNKIDKKIIPVLSISILLILGFLSLYTNSIKNLNKEKSFTLQQSMNPTETFFDGKIMKHKPDIYLLIYDAYVEENQMERLYNINNVKQMDLLKSQKFEIYKNIYSTGHSSLESMSNVVNLSNTFYFPNSVEYRKKINGESTINRILQKNGYKTHNVISDYLVRGSKQKVDYSYPSTNNLSASNDMLTIVEAILVGEFKFDLEYSKDYNKWINIKNKVIKTNIQTPVFLYSHSKYPGHSQNSGTLLINENQLFNDRLKLANKEMKNDISLILQKNKESIIIIAGDHGPYLTADGSGMLNYDESDITKDHILDRYGVFLAIRYPDKWKNTAYGNKIDVLQEVFVNVLANMYELKPPKNLVGKKSCVLNYNFNTPPIKDGIIQIGINKGESLHN